MQYIYLYFILYFLAMVTIEFSTQQKILSCCMQIVCDNMSCNSNSNNTTTTIIIITS